MGDAPLVTAVVGAGPAGLLFASLTKLYLEKAGINPSAWRVFVYDKRAAYARTHRLRIDADPYHELQRELGDERFDALVGFLEACEFTPEVNLYEEHLLALFHATGGTKSLLDVGPGPERVDLAALRARLESSGDLPVGAPFTIVGADSVHSAVRELVRGDVAPERVTHERIARVRVSGSALPRRLTAPDQVRLAKVLGSVLDYRLNRNGFAEVDLFLTATEHAVVRELGATPSHPVPLPSSALGALRAPLFRAIVTHLERTAPDHRVSLQSTFVLEHAVMPRLVFALPDLRAHAFLVGDAGISLPFQRGMTCLARCAASLARVHRDLVVARGDALNLGPIATRYDEEASEIRDRELRVVRRRAEIVRVLREIVRVSALLPFPVQSWWLRAKEPTSIAERLSARLSVWFFLNVGAALSAFVVALGGSWIDARVLSGYGWLPWTSVPIELAGGVVYHAAIAFDGTGARHVRRVWEVQIAALFFGGIALTALSSSAAGRLTELVASLWWLLLAAAFVAGLYVFERLVSGWFARARLD